MSSPDGGNGEDRPPRTFYGRRRGHRLTARRERLLAGLLPKLRIPREGKLDPALLFDPPPAAVWLEIGFGAGEHLAWQAGRHPEIGFLGAEPFVNGVASLLAAIEDRSLVNVRLHDGDGRDLVDRLAPASIARGFILFPDPWPKTRHKKRRLIDDGMTASLARVMAPGAVLRIASDIADYQRWILEHLRRNGQFEWLAARAADWRGRSADWPPTRYEEKALAEGRRPTYLAFRRR